MSKESGSDGEVAKAFEQAIATLRDTEAKLEEVAPLFASPAAITRRLFAARAAWTVQKLERERRALLDPQVAAAAEEGARLSAVEYLNAEAARIELVQALAQLHTQFDVLLTPTSAYPAPLASAGLTAPSGEPAPPSLAAPFSLTRQPALSIPCGTTRAGLPIGLQIVGRHFEDATVLAVARAYEHFQPFQPPPLHASGASIADSL